MRLATREPVPQIGRSSRPTRAAVQVTGNDAAAVGAALKQLKKVRDQEGLSTLLRRDSHLLGYLKPSLRRRRKQRRARALVRRVAAKRAARELQRDPDGRQPRGEVVNRQAAA